jgi:hypothetical protein
MIRARFKTDSHDYRPVKWPIKHPYWCTGYNFEGEAVIVAYADNEEQIKELWPEATAIDVMEENVKEYFFNGRFPKPEWLK